MEYSEKCEAVLFQMPKESPIYDVLYSIHLFYRPIHPYVSIFFSILGIICNFCNIVILTRKQMRTPVNVILTAIACFDTMVLFSYLIFVSHFSFAQIFDKCVPEKWSYEWAFFLIAHTHISLVGHSSSFWFLVVLAFLRYVTLKQRGKANAPVFTMKHSYMAIASVFVCVSLINIPNFMTYKITTMSLEQTCSRSQIPDPSLYGAEAFIPAISKYALYANCLLFRMSFWISGTIFKLVPCIFLTVLVARITQLRKEVRENRSCLLLENQNDKNNAVNLNFVPSADQSNVHQLNQTQTECTVISSTNHANANQTKAEFIRSSTPPASAIENETTNRTTDNRHIVPHDFLTTRMLLFIVCIFIVIELPQGIMAVLSGIFSEEFRHNVYNRLGDIFDLLCICAPCVYFAIYCSMSVQFRNEFRSVFLPEQKKCWRSLVSSSTERQRVSSPERQQNMESLLSLADTGEIQALDLEEKNASLGL